MDIRSVRTAGLGNTTYVASHDGVAIVVDPQRDIDRFEEVVADMGVHVQLVLETHIHNDYVSGGRSLAERLGADLVMPAGAAPMFRHRPAFHHEDVDLGSMVVRPIHTPGHTPEHTSYLVLIEGDPRAVFTGGSLLAGSAGRTDLLGWDRAESLARLQYGSVQRLARLPDATRLYPTHGAGSFCTTGGASRADSTIGDERATSPVLAHGDEESFVATQLSGLSPYPSYYQYMGPINLTGPEARERFEAPEITPAELWGFGESVAVVDARPITRYAAGHVPGSISVELKRDFGVWVGWLMPFDSPLVLVVDVDQDVEEALRQLSRIGFDDVRGVLRGIQSWDRPLAAHRIAGPEEFAAAAASGEQIIDTRSPAEWELGVIDGSTLLYVPDVVHAAEKGLDRARPVWVACATGFRAGISASLLAAKGFEPVVLAGSGVTEVLAAMSHND